MKIDGTLSKRAYMADFYVVPLGILFCLTLAFTSAAEFSLAWVDWFVGGSIAWLLFEYGLHRWFLHGPYKRQHWLHHIRPAGYVSVSTAFTFSAFAGLWGVVTSAAGFARSIDVFALGQCWFAGFYLAYLGYRWTHHVLHQWPDERLQASRYLKPLHDAHEVHHRTGKPCNFGVQTLWIDKLLGTFRR